VLAESRILGICRSSSFVNLELTRRSSWRTDAMSSTSSMKATTEASLPVCRSHHAVIHAQRRNARANDEAPGETGGLRNQQA
jgi:hypothetical protein